MCWFYGILWKSIRSKFPQFVHCEPPGLFAKRLGGVRGHCRGEDVEIFYGSSTQCGNLIIFLQLLFYVKSNSWNRWRTYIHVWLGSYIHEFVSLDSKPMKSQKWQLQDFYILQNWFHVKSECRQILKFPHWGCIHGFKLTCIVH